MVRTSPEREEVTKRPGEVVAGVGIHRLPQSEGNPDVNGEDVQVGSEVTPQEWSGDGP